MTANMDAEAFERLKTGDAKELRRVYEAGAAAFVRYIAKAFRCRRETAIDLYPEAFSILYLNIQHGKLTLPLRSSMQTYLNSIGWNLYHRRHLDKYNRSKVSSVIPEFATDTSELVDQALIQLERATQVRAYLAQLGDPCKTLLEEIYFAEKSYTELSVTMTLPETTLRKRKFDCLSKLRKLIEQQKPDL